MSCRRPNEVKLTPCIANAGTARCMQPVDRLTNLFWSVILFFCFCQVLQYGGVFYSLHVLKVTCLVRVPSKLSRCATASCTQGDADQ